MFRRMASHGGFPLTGHPAPPTRVLPSLPPTPSGYVPGAPIVATPGLREGLTRLQQGQTDFDVEGMQVAFSGIPEGLHNVLRDLQDSPLGKRANQLEAMTIEMVAMLFDFIFETRDLPDGIKALLARLQIPVLKVAMLDGAFFARKTHPSRLLVNALAAAGLGWSPAMGQDDPLYRTIERIVHRIIDGFGDNLGIFDELRAELEAFLATEEQAAEANFATTAEAINEDDRKDLAGVVAKSEVERRVESYPIPRFLADFLRQKWQGTLEGIYLREGEDSDAWSSSVATLEDLVWSVQPKKTPEDRKHLVALLPSLLKRLAAGVPGQNWGSGEREAFMANLVEAHAAAVKPSLADALPRRRRRSPKPHAPKRRWRRPSGDVGSSRARGSARCGDGAGRACRSPKRAPRCSTTSISRSRAAWIAGCGSNSRTTTASSRSRNLPGSARCAATTCSPIARANARCR